MMFVMSHVIFQLLSGTTNTESVQLVFFQSILSRCDLPQCNHSRPRNWGCLSTPTHTKTYCWWKKSCTTWDVYNPLNTGIDSPYQLVSPGFLFSTVYTTCLTVSHRPDFRATRLHHRSSRYTDWSKSLVRPFHVLLQLNHKRIRFLSEQEKQHGSYWKVSSSGNKETFFQCSSGFKQHLNGLSFYTFECIHLWYIENKLGNDQQKGNWPEFWGFNLLGQRNVE